MHAWIPESDLKQSINICTCHNKEGFVNGTTGKDDAKSGTTKREYVVVVGGGLICWWVTEYALKFNVALLQLSY